MTAAIILIVTYIILLIFAVYVPYMKLESYQTYEMTISTLLVVLIFGFLGSKLLNDPILLNKSFIIAICYLFWFYKTSLFINKASSDDNGVIRY